MSDRAPIPLDEFADALDSLDPDDLVAFVAELWAATSDDVGVDPPTVTVRSGGSRTDLLVAPAASDADLEGLQRGAANEPDTDGSSVPDAVVLPDEGSTAPDVSLETLSPADLRGRLLYALPMDDAESLCERFLGRAARSTSYDREPLGREPTEGDDGNAGTVDDGPILDRSTGGEVAADRGTGQSPVVPGTTGSSSDSGRDVAASRSAPGGRVTSGGADDAATDATAGDGEPPRGAGDGEPPRGAGDGEPPRGPDADSRRGRIAVAVVVLLLFATVAGAASLAGPSLSEGIGDRLDPGSEPTPTREDTPDGYRGSEVSDEDGDGSTPPHYYAEGIGGDDADPADSGLDGSLSDDEEVAARATALEPTCERGPLHVVQIQMNALGYNDPETNDGIRTTRRFASPRNRQAVSTFGQFVDIFDGTSYEPMLTHDSVRYTPLDIDGDRATVQAVTYENGSVTGRYEFRLRKMNASDGSSSGYDGCWMTDAVSVSPMGDSTEPTGTNGTEENSTVRGPPGT